MINKIVPQYLNKSDDERLVKAVEMTNAENIRISSDDDGDAGILKTIKGNQAVLAANINDELPFEIDSDVYQVLGQVSIAKKQQIIFFVHVTSNAQLAGVDTIYKYDVESRNYERIFQSSVLNFQDNTFIEANVVFNDKDETLVYFTDGFNPPRKINVDRAIADKSDIWADPDGLNYYSDDERKEFLEVCKSPPLEPITFEYSTDTNYLQNNLIDKSFQFAYQYIYQDGENSAISTYSKLAINPNTYGEGVVNTSFQTLNNKLTLTFTSGDSEVKKVRILSRLGGSTVFYKIGEVDNPSTATGTFTFFNDGSYPAVSTTEVDKIYDNVPLKANAQSISGNRLMYGDYTEGFNNISINVDSSVVYDTVEDPGVITATLEQPNGGPSHIVIDGTSMASTYNDGAIITLRVTLTGGPSGAFRLSRQAEVEAYLFSESFDDGSHSFTAGVGKTNDVGSYVDVPFYNRQVVLSATVVPSVTMTRDEILDELASQLDAEENISYSYVNNGVNFNATGYVITSDGTGHNHDPGDPVEMGLDFPSIEIDFDQDTAYSVTSKRKIDLDIVTLQTKVHLNTLTGWRMITVNGTLFNDPNATVATSIPPANIEYVLHTNMTLPINIQYAYEAGITSFKTSAIHSFGIVYYDDKGRSSFVQKIDGVYVGGYADPSRSTNKGRVRIHLKIKHNPPSWATKYQIVYAGNETYTDFLQFGVGGAHKLTADASTNEGQNSIYLDLFPLEGKPNSYVNDRGANIDYTYSENDILRIVSYYDDNETRQYIDGYEFAVIGKEVVTTAAEVTPPRKSTFVVIRDEDYGNKPLDDWSLADVVAGSDKWGQRVIVEIASPKKVNNDIVYHEIGEVYDIVSGAHVGDTTDGGFPVVILEDGDVYFKPREILSAPFDSGASKYDEDDYDGYEYDVLYVESNAYSDFFNSDYTSRGRPHAILDDAREVRRRASITYSDPYVIDGDKLSLSSFNVSTANFVDYDIRHGKIDRLIDQTDRLYIFQEHKVGFAQVNRQLLQTLTDGNVVVSSNVLGTASYYAGDFGSSGYPAAIVERFGIMYYVDVKAQKVLRISRDGIYPISDNNMDSYFDSKFSEYLIVSNKTEMDIVAGYDPDNDEYVITSKDISTYTGFTVAFDHQKKQWTSFYSFKPNLYSNINDKFFSFYGDGIDNNKSQVMWEHGVNSTYGRFYNVNYPAKFSVVSNLDASAVKSYDTISIEGNKAWSATLSTSDQQTTIAVNDYDEREREFVASIPRDTQNSTGNYIVIGETATAVTNGTEITFKNKVNTQPLPIGAALYYDNAGTLTSLSANLASVDTSKKITASASISSIPVNSIVVLSLSAKEEGDQLRDYYCKVDFQSSHSSNKIELFAVNMHFNNETLHSNLGVQSVANK